MGTLQPIRTRVFTFHGIPISSKAAGTPKALNPNTVLDSSSSLGCSWEVAILVKMVAFHFDDIIVVQDVDVEGKKYDKVSRIDAKSEDGIIFMQLDVNSDIYPMLPKQKYRTVLSETLDMDGSSVTSYSSEGKQKSLADKFEYVMHGLLYKISEERSKGGVKVIVYISFGGLQLMITGPPIKMHRYKVDQRLFLLLRKM